MAEGASRRPIQAIVALTIVVLAVAALSFALLVPLGGDRGPTTVGGHPLLDEPAPEIELLSFDGEVVSLSSLRGRPVLVNFWATWCLPCREEFPLMAAAYEQHAGDGLEILGVLHDDTVEGARAYAEDMDATWPMLDDADDVAWEDYSGVGMPTSFFVDPDGVIRAFSLGGFTEAGLAAQLARILPEG